ncbi:hypothetical protein BBJ28_00025336 [Nothophytophthora sp. Chile5]|nr:hypothetical protein BBJ28_00025336 [Nothophytophthora sp. Chile5]
MDTEGALASTTNHQEQELKQEQEREYVDATRMRPRIAPLDEGVRAPLTTVSERQNGRPASVRAARPRPFGGKLRIDVTAAEKEAELASPLVVGSPLGYYATKKLPSNAHEAHPVSMFGPTESHTVGGPLPNASPFLEYGMLVSLVCDDRNGVIAAEGFASRDMRLERLNYGMEVPLSRLGLGGHEERKLFAEGGFRLLSCPFRDCLFEIVPKMTYDATITLKSLAEDDGRTPRRSSNQHTLANLKFKSDAEIRLNAMMYKKLKGTQVIYGHYDTLYRALWESYDRPAFIGE